MASQSLYRKYRPQTFADVVGQEHIEMTLRNALAADRVSHAYLFCGPRGTGKTTTARLLAKALLCDKAPTANPDGTCSSCQQVAEGNHPDVYELDAASRTGVDNVREEIIGRVAFSPTQGRYKVYIIDEVHMLSTQAFNALLKTLEEPPAHVVFVLCTTDPQKVPATIISRCQRFDFHRLTTEQIAQCLAQICEGEGFEFDPAAIDLIAQQARGGMRDAITSLEQVAVFGNGNVNFAAAENMFGDVDAVELSEVFECVARRDAAGCFIWVDRLAMTGIDVASVVRSMLAYARNLYVLKLTGDETIVTNVTLETMEALRAQVGMFESVDRLASLLVTLGDVQTELRTAVDARLTLEVALTRMAHPSSELTLEALAARVSMLESGQVPMPAPAMAGGFGAQAPAAATEAEARPAPLQGRQEPAGAAIPQSSPAAVASEPAAPPVSEPRRFQQETERQTAAPAVASAPVPAPAPAPASGAGRPLGGPADLARIMGDASSLRRAWENAIREAEKHNPLVSGFLGGSIPHGDYEHSRVVVDLPSDSGFGLGILNSTDMKSVLENALSGFLGGRVQIEYVLGATAAAVDPVQQAPASTFQDMRQAASPATPAAEVPAPQPQVAQAPAPQPQAAQAPFRPEPAPWEQPAPAPAAQAPSQPEPAPAPQVPAPANRFDEVPLSAYDDMAPDAAPSAPAPAPAPGPAQQSPAPLQGAPQETDVDDEVAAMFRRAFSDHVKFD